MPKLLFRAFLVVLCAFEARPQTVANLITNGAFSTAPGSLSSAWTLSTGAAGKGSATVTSGSQGTFLRLAPSSANPASAWLAPPYGYAQGIPASAIGASKLYVTALLRADPGSTAVLTVTSLWTDGSQTVQEIRQAPVASPVFRRDAVFFPSGKTLLAVVLTCSVEGSSGAAYFGSVSLSAGLPATWLEAIGQPDTGAAYESTIAVDAAQKGRTIPSTLFGSNLEWPWDGMGVWNSSAATSNLNTVAFARQAGFTVERFPGGLYADYYDWRNGVGVQTARPAASPLPGASPSLNTFGTDEAMQFAGATSAELLITVNILTGTPQQAADWVRYVNASGTRVRYWEIGNESYSTAMTPDQYAALFLQFAQAMRAVDPNIKLGAIADEQYGHSVQPVHPGWTDRVLTLAGSQIDWLAVHCGYAPLIFEDRGWDIRTVYAAELAAPALIASQLTDLTARIARIVPARASSIAIAVTEWGPLFQMDPSGRFVDHQKTLTSALYTASALKAFIQAPQVTIADFFKLVDNTFMGSIGFRSGQLAAKASLYAIQMLHQNFGTTLVSTTVTALTYDSPAVGWVDAVSGVSYLECLSSTSANGKTLYILAINKHLDRAAHSRISLANFHPAGTGHVYTLNGSAPDANTGTDNSMATGVTFAQQALIQPYSRFYSGSPTEVAIQSGTLSGVGATLDYTFPAHSVTILAIDGK